jgi:hypothetical protein
MLRLRDMPGMQHVEILAISCETGVIAIRCATCGVTTIRDGAPKPQQADLWYVVLGCPPHRCGAASEIDCFAVKGAA